jgi:UDP-N-acetyl-D-mannosaminuronic acid dehydrogenase
MALSNLSDKIRTKEALIAVIGLGYVGLPVACEFARAGFGVLGVEKRQDKVDKINAGICPIEGDEPGIAELLTEILNKRSLRATANYQDLRDRDVILIDVETPVDQNNIPRYEALRAAIRSLGPLIKYGCLVIIESTIAPGTIQNVVLPLLEESSGWKVNEGFYLGNCPERVMPGKLLSNLRSLSRVVGGMTPETADTMVLLYRKVVMADLDPVDCITAELVKTVENAYRDVQIAFANEVALICESVGGNVWKVRELVNKSPFRSMHLPGAGVGGHCIPKDPWLLAYGVQGKDVPLRLIPASREINDNMPLHMVSLLEDALAEAGRELAGSKILIFGYAYLEDSDDTRNSPSEILLQRLGELGAEVFVHDPYVMEYQASFARVAANCDAAMFMVKHSQYLQINLADLKAILHTPVLIDGRKIFDADKVQEAGFYYRCIGESNNLSKKVNFIP